MPNRPETQDSVKPASHAASTTETKPETKETVRETKTPAELAATDHEHEPRPLFQEWSDEFFELFEKYRIDGFRINDRTTKSNDDRL